MELAYGQQLGHYRIERKIGEGGMGAVYLASDVRLDRQVALKVLSSELTTDEERRLRFRQEAMLAAAFNHPNIATVYDVGEESGVTFIVMEYVRGESLRDLIRDEPLPVERALDLAVGIAAGLAKAHSEGVLHRDLKPDNVVLTSEGVPKILDFGLGKLLGDRTPSAEPIVSEIETMTADGSPYVTHEGQILGTLAYMSPEQVQGRPVDARSDVFSFGALLYELLAAKRPFVGESLLDTASAILRDAPAPLGEWRRDVPEELEEILGRCLAKDPEKRFASGQELYEALSALERRLETPEAGLGSLLRRPVPLATAALVIALGFAGAVWLAKRSSRVSWARNEALPEIQSLLDKGDQDAAFRLLREASAVIPDDPFLEEYLRAVGDPITLESDPTGATVFVKGYDHPEREWIRLGETPIQNAPLPFPARFRVEKEGFVPFEGAPFVGNRLTFRLFEEGETPRGMVYVGAGSVSFGSSPPVRLAAFWIDKYEVTNREYEAFIDAGGYREDRFWDPAVDRGAFVDTTGRPGPAGWALGSYPQGDDDLPVGGVSWYEAKAFAAWAGKSLPTVFHWRIAAQQSIFSEILLWSNFDSKGPAPVGSYDGLGPVGTYDMAGNVREWCLNATGDTRYVLGGAWLQPDYLYRSADAIEPTDRLPVNGFRCIRTHGDPPAESLAAIDNPIEDHRQDTPVGDDLFALLRRDFAYDPRDLGVEVESSDVEEAWRHDVVSIRAAYGEERFRIHLFLPKDGEAPYQAVVYFPPSSALFLRDGSKPSFPLAYFIPRSGRALVVPIYKRTYDRRVEWHGPNDYRDLLIQDVKDLRRTIDYLETRADIDSDKLAYYGLSWGAQLGPVMTALEPRFAASILLSGGLKRFSDDWPPGAVPQNFAPRSTVPTLMINGRKDFGYPVETNVRPMFDLLGTPAEKKRLVLLDGGHVPARPNEVIREVLDWLDLYLGPVSGAS